MNLLLVKHGTFRLFFITIRLLWEVGQANLFNLNQDAQMRCMASAAAPSQGAAGQKCSQWDRSAQLFTELHLQCSLPSYHLCTLSPAWLMFTVKARAQPCWVFWSPYLSLWLVGFLSHWNSGTILSWLSLQLMFLYWMLSHQVCF